MSNVAAAGHRHLVGGDRLEPILRQIAWSRIAVQHGRAAPSRAEEPPVTRYARSGSLADLAREHGVPALVRPTRSTSAAASDLAAAIDPAPIDEALLRAAAVGVPCSQ